jgi:Nif-specific regulatory protein
MAGNADQWQAVYAWIDRVAILDVPVLIRGERGTGKKDVAQALHERSRRRGNALVKVDCALLPAMAAETGRNGKPAYGELMILAGCLKLAKGGTLLLEHLERLPLSAQARLLKVIRGGAIKTGVPLEPAAYGMRIAATTSEPLEEWVDAGRFDGGLFEALGGESVRLPALRETGGDILPLLQHFLESEATLQGKAIRRVSPAVADLLLAYDWPGNAGEFRACVETAVAQCRDGILRAHHFPSRLYAAIVHEGGNPGALESAMSALEYDLVVEALALRHGNIAAAARYLGVTERVMGCRVKKYRLDLRRFAGPETSFTL